MEKSWKLELIVLISTAWISISSASVLVLLSGANAFSAAFWRLLISSAIITLSSVFYYKKLTITFSLIPLASGFFLGLHFLLWMQSLFLIPVALSTTIVVTYPAIIAILEAVILKERISSRQTAGMLTAFFGVIFMVRPSLSSGGNIAVGIALAGIASFLAAGYFFLGRIARKGGTGLSQYTLPTYLTAALTVFIAGAVERVSILPDNALSWVYLVLLAVVPMIGGHTVMNYLLSREKASFVSSIALGEPLGATLLSYIILKQNVGEGTIIGMLITIAGLFLLIAERASVELKE